MGAAPIHALTGTVPIDVLKLVLSHHIEVDGFDGITPPSCLQNAVAGGAWGVWPGYKERFKKFNMGMRISAATK